MDYRFRKTGVKSSVNCLRNEVPLLKLMKDDDDKNKIMTDKSINLIYTDFLGGQEVDLPWLGDFYHRYYSTTVSIDTLCLVSVISMIVNLNDIVKKLC